jgi:hypothetical protein
MQSQGAGASVFPLINMAKLCLFLRQYSGL